MKIQRDPDIEIAGLKIWVHKRQFPDVEDYWDGNWLDISACCRATQSEVWATGSILHASELESWLIQLRKFSQTLKESAALKTMEPYISVKLTANQLGHVQVNVSITPDHLTQQHEYEFDIDQTYLNPLISGIENVLSKYPLKGKH
jgi:hypothetical protein